jgi:anti-sigma B factor antagonist
MSTATKVVLAGEIDLASVPALEAALLGTLEERPVRLILDLSAVDFLDSSGVHLLERVRAAADRAAVAFAAVGPDGPARQVFELCGREGIVTAVSPSRGPSFLTDWTL